MTTRAQDRKGRKGGGEGIRTINDLELLDFGKPWGKACYSYRGEAVESLRKVGQLWRHPSSHLHDLLVALVEVVPVEETLVVEDAVA